MNKTELSDIVKVFTLKELKTELESARRNNNTQDIKILIHEINSRK